MGELVVGANVFSTTSIDLVYGSRVWNAQVSLADEVGLAIGTQVKLLVDETSFAGTIVRGDTFVGRSHYVIVGGGGGWRLEIAPDPLRSDGGIRLASAVDRLVGEAQKAAVASGGAASAETAVVEGDRVLGTSYAPLRASGARLLSELVGNAWYMDRFGVTQIQRTSQSVIDATRYAFDAHDPSVPWARVATRDPTDLTLLVDAIGGEMTGDPLPTALAIKQLRIVEQRVLRIEVS